MVNKSSNSNHHTLDAFVILCPSMSSKSFSWFFIVTIKNLVYLNSLTFFIIVHIFFVDGNLDGIQTHASDARDPLNGAFTSVAEASF